MLHVVWCLAFEVEVERFCLGVNARNEIPHCHISQRVLCLLRIQPAVRQEAGHGVYRLCLGKTAEGRSGYCYLLPTLASMISFLEDAQSMKPVQRVSTYYIQTKKDLLQHEKNLRPHTL